MLSFNLKQLIVKSSLLKLTATGLKVIGNYNENCPAEIKSFRETDNKMKESKEKYSIF